jgi:hypothetical protein
MYEPMAMDLGKESALVCWMQCALDNDMTALAALDMTLVSSTEFGNGHWALMVNDMHWLHSLGIGIGIGMCLGVGSCVCGLGGWVGRFLCVCVCVGGWWLWLGIGQKLGRQTIDKQFNSMSIY